MYIEPIDFNSRATGNIMKFNLINRDNGDGYWYTSATNTIKIDMPYHYYSDLTAKIWFD